MAQARGNAVINATVLLLSMVLYIEVAHATTYTVGDTILGGWNLNVHDWPIDKAFRADDILVFNYDKGQHNVAVVDENGYNSCTVGDQVFSSGNDEIQLQEGQNYFICGFPGHCNAGMKMLINATI